MSRYTLSVSVLIPLLALCAVSSARESRYAQTHSDSQYVHWIDLYDANNRKIDPTAEDAPPYSPEKTCGRCHDYEAISHGYHFNAPDVVTDGSSVTDEAPSSEEGSATDEATDEATDDDTVPRPAATAGRPGEPWIWTDVRTGTQLPLSHRGWSGTYDPDALGISDWDFVLKFGTHMPGGGPGEPAAEETEAAEESEEGEEPEPEESEARWELAGQLNVDCLICHSNDPAYSQEIRGQQIEEENFAWAPTAAMGLADVEGSVSRLPDDFDPETVDENSRYKLPQTAYRPLRANSEKEVFIDVVRKPHDNACYYCHTTRLVGENAGPAWIHDQDVHLRAGMSCSDCHRNGIGHHTVRGYEGEVHPTGQSIVTLSCRGCHLGDAQHPAGRLGAPKPLHKGLPPLHLERLSCTACHSGVGPTEQAFQEQTARAHGLGLPSHDYAAEMAPGIVTSILLDDGGRLYPHRMMWPSFWGSLKGGVQDGTIQPLNPEAVYDATRRTLRVRSSEAFAEALTDVRLSSEDKASVLGEDRAKISEDEWTEDEKAKMAELEKTKGWEAYQEKLAEALEDLKEIIEDEGAEPVYVSGGKAFRLGDDGSVEEFENAAAQPYAWKLAHNVRPAGYSSGVTGCYECHSLGSPIFEGRVTTLGQAPVPEPVTQAMYELADLDKTKLDAWNLSFQSRALFKWFAFGAMGIVSVILLYYLLAGIDGILHRDRRA